MILQHYYVIDTEVIVLFVFSILIYVIFIFFIYLLLVVIIMAKVERGLEMVLHSVIIGLILYMLMVFVLKQKKKLLKIVF